MPTTRPHKGLKPAAWCNYLRPKRAFAWACRALRDGW